MNRLDDPFVWFAGVVMIAAILAGAALLRLVYFRLRGWRIS